MEQFGFGAEIEYAIDPRLPEFFDDTVAPAAQTAVNTAALKEIIRRLEAIEAS